MKIDQDTLSRLSLLEYSHGGKHVRITEQLDRSAYKRVDAALAALGGAWSRRDKAHVFPGDARPAVDLAITTGAVTTDADLGHFPTPPSLARELVQIADVRPGHSALEPSAGGGRIIDALLAAGATVTAVERDPHRRRQIAARPGSVVVLETDDFMLHDPGLDRARFDRVVMNPPFARVGAGDHLDHIRHAHRMLRPGGVLVSVLPSSLTFRRDRRYAEAREFYRSNGTIRPLPDGSFRESGTGVATVVVRLEASS